LDAQGLGEQNVLLFFIKAECPHCRASLPQVEKLYAEIHDAGVRVLLVSESDAEPTAALTRELRISAPVFLDRAESMRTQFSLLHTPAFLWYRQGVLHDKAVGSKAVSEMGERVRGALVTPPGVAQR
jgi:peroxiredoxin